MEWLRSLCRLEGREKKMEKPIKVTLYDGFAMKKMLDDTIVKIAWSQPDLPDNTSWSNVKLALMAVSCAAAALAQFYPLPFPDNRTLLAICVAVYFALSGVLQYITSYVDKDAVWWGLAHEGRPACLIRTRMGKYDSVLTVIAECPPGVEVGRCSHSVGEFFRENGDLVEEAVEDAIEEPILGSIRAVGAKKDK